LVTATIGLAQTFGIESYGKLARVTDPHISPDGLNAVLVVSRPNYEDDKFESELFRVDLSTRRVKQLTYQRKTARFPRWSPSGDKLAFLAESAGQNQIFVLEKDGGEALQVSRAATGVQAFAWKPDGSEFAYLSRDEAPRREKYDDSFEVEANDYTMQAGTQPVHLWTIASTGGNARRLTSGHWSVSGTSLAWSPSGDRIVIVSQPSSGTRDSDKHSIETVGLGGGAPVRIAGLEGRHCNQPSFSPDGHWLGVVCPIDGRVKKSG
jgi:Tol biopolymer transport system component